MTDEVAVDVEQVEQTLACDWGDCEAKVQTYESAKKQDDQVRLGWLSKYGATNLWSVGHIDWWYCSKHWTEIMKIVLDEARFLHMIGAFKERAEGESFDDFDRRL